MVLLAMAKDTTPAPPDPVRRPAGRHRLFSVDFTAVGTENSTENSTENEMGPVRLAAPVAADVTREPVEPPPSEWGFPSPERASPEGIVAVGADLEPGTLLAAYRSGLFPMPIAEPGGREVLAWWSPDPRAVIPLDGLRVSRSLRRSCRRFEVTVDTAFGDVIAACADERRPGRWITPAIEAAYVRLHELGWAHSVEVWSPGGELAGGLYGVAVGALFAGESMFHRRTDASKVALVALVDRLRAAGSRVLDVQWATPHLRSLGAVEIPRARYLTLVADAVTRGDSTRAWDRQWRHG